MVGIFVEVVGNVSVFTFFGAGIVFVQSFSLSHSLHYASITELLSVFSRGTADCLHQQVLLNCSAMYNFY